MLRLCTDAVEGFPQLVAVEIARLVGVVLFEDALPLTQVRPQLLELFEAKLARLVVLSTGQGQVIKQHETLQTNKIR